MRLISHIGLFLIKWFYGKTNFKIFSKFLSTFFSVFLTPSTSKKIFLHFWAKNNLLLYTWRTTCPFDPPKCFLEDYSTKCPRKAPPPQYPDILEPVQSRVKRRPKYHFKVHVFKSNTHPIPIEPR